MRMFRVVLMLGIGILVSLVPAAWAQASSITLKCEKFIDPYIGPDGAVMYLPKVYVEHPGTASVSFDIFNKRAETPLSYDAEDDEWSWVPQPPPVDAWDYTLNELNDGFSGLWTLTLDAGLASESAYSFTLNPLQYADFASTPEFYDPVEGADHPANYAFQWWFREGAFIPGDCHLSMSVEHDATGQETEVDSRWPEPDHIDLSATSHAFPSDTLLAGETIARVQYTRYDTNRLTGFVKESGEDIAWDGPPELKLQAGQNITCDVVAPAVANGGFTPSNPADPTNPPDPQHPFAGWTMFGPDQSVTAVQNPFDLPENYVPQFTAWSPGGMTQVVDTPEGPFYVVFDVAWTSVPGAGEDDATFSILIDGVAIGTLTSPDVPDTDWQEGSFRVANPSLWELSDVELQLSIDGPTGSSLLLDNLEFSNLPEPATLALLGMGVAGLLHRRRR